MTEFLTTYLEPILAFITGGGLLSFVTLKFTRKQAEANAMKAVQEVYQETIKDLRNSNDYLKDEIQYLKGEIQPLMETVSQNSKDIAVLQRYKCTVLECSLRKTE